MPKLQQNQRCMDPGTLGTFVDEFTNQLTAVGHTWLTVANYADTARHFAEWLRRSEIVSIDIDDGVIAQFARHRCKCSGNRQHQLLSAKYVRRVRRFVGFLVEHGVAKAAASNASKAVNERVIEFQDWLRHHRGLSERTVDRHGRMVMRLLAGLGDDPKRYDAECVRQVILTEVQRSSRPYRCSDIPAIIGALPALRRPMRHLGRRPACVEARRNY
jgi:integrase/recombinase XerD